MLSENYRIQLDIFEGPMDLLLFLIQKHELDITNIPIRLITDQYLAYLEVMKTLNVDLAADFLLMAAILIQVKSRMLLPTYEEGLEEDPRLELTRPLLEYLQLKEAARVLEEKALVTNTSVPRGYSLPSNDEISFSQTLEIFDLVIAFQNVLKNLDLPDAVVFVADEISVQDRMTEIIALLEIETSVLFEDLFKGATSRMEVVVTFLAILEMAKIALIRIVQGLNAHQIRIFYQ